MSEIENMIQRTHGFSTRYAQEYLDFNKLTKQMCYKYKRKEQATELYEIIKDTDHIKNSLILETQIPVSLKEAYFEFRYGISSDIYISKQQIS